MSSRFALHNSKKEAIFQLCNFLCPCSVLQITDLADGEILQKAIQAKFPEFSNDIVNCEKIPFGCPDKLNSEKEDKSQLEDCSKLNYMENDESKIEDDEYIQKTSEHLMKNKKESIIPITFVKSNESHPAKNEDILLRFNYIQKFIDEHYQIKSEDIVSYSKCTKSCELELTKVAIFVLSEIVKYLVKVKNEDLQTLCHVEIKHQIELQECFNLFISGREKISKAAVEKLLSKSAGNASPVVTPRRTSSRRTSSRQKFVSPPAPSEDIYTNSPLKTYFESPIFKKEDILMKEKHIENLKKILDDEEEQSVKLYNKLFETQKELKKKDKEYKELQIRVAEMKTEIQSLQNSCQSESCKAEKEKLFTENKMSKSNAAYLTNRIGDLSKEITELRRLLIEKENLEDLKRMESKKPSPLKENSVLITAAQKIKALEAENEEFRKTIENLELKNHAYKKQLSELILTDLKEKKSPGNLNQSYEEIWNELDRERNEKPENIGQIIEEDNKMLSTKLNEANLEIKKLLEEIEILKKQTTKKNNLSDHRKKVHSVGTMTMSELIDTTAETERLRSSLNHSKNVEHFHLSDEPSYILNNSDDPAACEHSFTSSKSGAMLCPEKSSEAVLWKMYNSEKSETENTYGINLGHNSVLSENSHLDLINDLRMNNDKIDNAEADVLLGQENKYVLGNLNFNVFLNELKKLTKNGSFQKVLQVFGKRQKEINGTNRSNRLDLQEMLKMITECVCVAVALNAESSFTNLQDKCCLTDENDFCNVNDNLELDQLKKKLSSVSEEHEMELKEWKKELEEVKKRKDFFELKYQTCDRKLSEKIHMYDELSRRYTEIRINYDHQLKKYSELKDEKRRICDSKRKLDSEFQELKKKTVYLTKKRTESDNNYLKLRQKNGHLKEQLQKCKEKISEINALKEKESKDFLLPSNDSCIGIPNLHNVKSELQSSSLQDTTNESVLSGAFHKNLSHYVSENEEDYFNYNSLDIIKKDYKEDRVEELKRRNSFLPLHLQSAYPVEANLHTAYESLYVKDAEKNLEESNCKKRKLDDVILEEASNSTLETPVIPVKPKRRIGTPKSIQKFMRNVRFRPSMKSRGGS